MGTKLKKSLAVSDIGEEMDCESSSDTTDSTEDDTMDESEHSNTENKNSDHAKVSDDENETGSSENEVADSSENEVADSSENEVADSSENEVADSSENEVADSSENEVADSSENELAGSEHSDNANAGNAGWADAMSKVLRTTKPKKKKTLVLSRAKKLTDYPATTEIKKEEPGFEIDGEIKQEDADEKPIIVPTAVERAKEKEQKRKRKVWDNLCRIKPNVLEKDRERALSKIATKGVVQLFNAVRQQQKSIESRLKAAGSSERKHEQVLKSVDKNSFLDILMGPTRSTIIGHQSKEKEDNKIKNEEEGGEGSLWSVLRDDFLVGGNMKDWDKGAQDTAETQVESADIDLFSDGSFSDASD